MVVTQTALDISERVERRLEALGAPEDQSHPWRIDGRETADWAARKRAKAFQALQRVQVDAATQRNEIMDAVASYLFPIDLWEKDETERLGREVAHWEAKLAEYHRDVLAEDDHAKTIKLPHAQLHARKQPDKWEFGDEFLSWAKTTMPHLVRIKEEVAASTAKASLKALDRTDEGQLVSTEGEVIPGLTVIPGAVTYTIEQDVEL